MSGRYLLCHHDGDHQTVDQMATDSIFISNSSEIVPLGQRHQLGLVIQNVSDEAVEVRIPKELLRPVLRLTQSGVDMRSIEIEPIGGQLSSMVLAPRAATTLRYSIRVSNSADQQVRLSEMHYTFKLDQFRLLNADSLDKIRLCESYINLEPGPLPSLLESRPSSTASIVGLMVIGIIVGVGLGYLSKWKQN